MPGPSHPVEVQNLNKQYKKGPWANRDISLTVEWGEVLGILGPNGAGKTTLVRQITTELVPTSGNVYVMGHDAVAEPNLVKSFLGVVPQEANLFYGLSLWHHLRIFGKLRGLSRRNAVRRAEELISQLGLGEHRDKPSERLSGGLRRRLLVGIAALAEPPLLVLDEPTTGLDVESRRSLWELLRSYKRPDSGVLLTTHYMEEAEALCDRVGIIQGGRLLALDTVANLRSSLGFDYKATYESDAGTQTLYGDDERALVEQLRERRVDQYAIGRTTLEDVYLAITNAAEGVEDAGRTN